MWVMGTPPPPPTSASINMWDQARLVSVPPPRRPPHPPCQPHLTQVQKALRHHHLYWHCAQEPGRAMGHAVGQLVCPSVLPPAPHAAAGMAVGLSRRGAVCPSAALSCHRVVSPWGRSRHARGSPSVHPWGTPHAMGQGAGLGPGSAALQTPSARNPSAPSASPPEGQGTGPTEPWGWIHIASRPGRGSNRPHRAMGQRGVLPPAMGQPPKHSPSMCPQPGAAPGGAEH